MDVRELKALLNLMAENGVIELEIEDKKGKVRLVRGAAAAHDHQNSTMVAALPKPAALAKGQRKITAPTVDKAARSSIELQANQKLVESPMVGTFYRAASPDSDPF